MESKNLHVGLEHVYSSCSCTRAKIKISMSTITFAKIIVAKRGTVLDRHSVVLPYYPVCCLWNLNQLIV